MYTTLDDFHFVGVKCRAMEALYIIFILVIIDFGRCFRVIGLIPSGPGDYLLSNLLKAGVFLSSLIQSLYQVSSSDFDIDTSGKIVSFFTCVCWVMFVC